MKFLLCILVCTLAFANADRTEPFDIQNRLVGYVFAVDNVLSGNVTNEALNALMDFFSNSPGFVWGDISNPVGLPYSQVRQNYVFLANNIFHGFCRHFLAAQQIEPVGRGRNTVWVQKGYYYQYSVLTVFGDP